MIYDSNLHLGMNTRDLGLKMLIVIMRFDTNFSSCYLSSAVIKSNRNTLAK